MTPGDLDNRFNYHKPDEKAVVAHETIRRLCRNLAGSLNELLPESREKALAITHLEETMMWGNAAIARSA
ncbi:Acb2/Tad1 domain-containing protein [Nonomuraea sp. SYSU D8015]|uniref:Acb2/Tad1 domain-containing protein n=1 Tax=Nonomuraea sp. SYSU D8015 TaxID=2593644 RepID=UPI0016608BCE|nr:hypothetical protein [Nonomuraea sp. SYSU D8015]